MKITNFLTDIGRPVAYYPKLSVITNGVKEAIFLCQLLYWHGKQTDKEQWIYKTQADMAEETGLSRTEQETARRNLKKKGFIIEKKKGIPCKLHYKICFSAIDEAWQTCMAEPCKQVCGNPANKNVETLQTITETTTETTTENTHNPPYNPPKGDDEQTKPNSTEVYRDRFDTFWEVYPKKVGKGAARKVWLKIKPSQALTDKMVKAIKTQETQEQWLKDRGQYIPNPLTWLNQERWEDEPIKSQEQLTEGEFAEPSEELLQFVDEIYAAGKL